jgi:hypothetical protein
MAPRNDLRGDSNRVLVGLPARLEAARSALRENEKLLEQLRQLYGQRLLLKDSVVLDQMGDLLGCPPLPGDPKPKPNPDRPRRYGAHAASANSSKRCPACTNGDGPLCEDHKWMAGF